MLYTTPSLRFAKPPVGAELDWGHPLAQGLVHCCLYTERGAGRVTELVTRSTGVLTNGAAWADTPAGFGVLTDGTNDFVNFTGNVTRVQEAVGANLCSLAMWVSCTDTTKTNAYPFSVLDEIVVLYGFVARTYELYLNGGLTRQTIKQLTAGDAAEHLIAFSFDGVNNTVKAYFDGVQTLSAAAANDLAGAITSFTVGSSTTLGQNPFAGVFSQTMLWKRPLAADEMWSLYRDRYSMIRRATPLFVDSVAAGGVPRHYMYYQRLRAA
jgi:hypothetical protein